MTNYFGHLCYKHPELRGERTKWSKCVQCSRDSTNKSNRKLVLDPNGSGDLISYSASKVRQQLQTPEGRAYYLAKTRKRELAEQQRIPLWVTEFELGLMARFYQLASHLGLVVDHIVPLRGRNVSGFHCFANLDMLTHSENASKSNNWSI